MAHIAISSSLEEFSNSKMPLLWAFLDDSLNTFNDEVYFLALVSKVPDSTKGCDEVGQWQAPAQAPYGNKQTHMIFAMGKLINFITCVFSVGFRTWPTDTDS